MKRIVRVLFSIILFLSIIGTNNSNKIIINKKDVYVSNTNVVTDRELAMLASLVYEDVPNDSNYDKSYLNTGCVIENNQIKTSCYFDFDENNYVTRDGKKILQYVEGMSERKKNLFTELTTANIEDGEKYYFYTFASTKEEAKNWEIVNYKQVSKNEGKNSLSWSGQFSAITFKKGNNYVIAYRGTDYPDVLEWLQDIAYAVQGEHDQAGYAHDYAVSEYNRIVSSDKSANIYVTGHSLGAYLAQIGGAAIVDAGKVNGVFDASKSSNLKKVVYFNGMGVSGIGLKTEETKKYRDALEFLGKTSTTGVTSPNTLNYSNDMSSGRLILYSMDGDPVSGLGIHYGEIRKLQPAADAVSNHKGNHMLKSKTEDVAGIISKLTKAIKKAKGGEIDDTNLTVSEKESDNKLKGIVESLFKYTKLKDNINKNLGKLSQKYNVALPEIGDKFDSGLYAVFDIKNFLSGFSSMSEKYKLGDITEVANISHETDSFMCLIDSEYGIPTVQGEAVNAVYKNSTESNTVDVYTNGKDITLLTANASGGCIRSYNWYKTDKFGNDTEIETDSNKINNYAIIDKNSNAKNGDVEYYKVVATYGNTYQTQKLQKTSSGKYEYVLDSTKKTFVEEEARTQGQTKAITQIYAVKYDKEAPKCTFSVNSVKLKKGGTANVTLTCSDESGVEALTNSGFKLTGKDYYIKHSANCSGNVCNITIKANKIRILRVDTQLKYTLDVKDKSGNVTKITNTLKISTKK